MTCPNYSPAMEALVEAFADQERLIALRQRGGDCFAGAVAVGATEEEALQIAIDAHMNPDLRDRIAASGGLLVGAEQYFEGAVNG